MIKYKLVCKNCDNFFDSWFATSKEYEKLKKLKYINCDNCHSLKVEKTLMTPSVLNSKKEKSAIYKNKKYTKLKNTIKEYQKFITNNFEYVGEDFPYKARSIHYNNKKSSKGIYGNATTKEVKELKEEGIETEVIPWVNQNDN
jgi:hypothetical protein